MFNNLFNKFKTEKELILHIIDCYSDESVMQEYNRVARKEWKKKYYKNCRTYQVYSYDSWLMRHLAKTSDDEDIIRALFGIRGSDLLYDSTMPMSVNENLPDDIFDHCLNWNSDDIKELTCMSKVKYKINGEIKNTKITNHINGLIAMRRKKKEDKTKIKLKAFLITADATKSVLTGDSIDDVVEATITENVDEQVLNYMNKLLGKVK